MRPTELLVNRNGAGDRARLDARHSWLGGWRSSGAENRHHPGRLLAAIVASIALGCSSSPEASSDSVAADSVAATGAPTTTTAPWYARATTLDLTGDGRPDSVHLEARGERVDSLDVVLTIHVDGVERHREAWGSSYELEFVDSAVRAGPEAEGILRGKLDSVLASVEVLSLDAPAVRLMAEDSVVLDSLDTRPTQLIRFSYGYETTTRLVWDAPRARFVRMWSCC